MKPTHPDQKALSEFQFSPSCWT